jgi:hypothetical protein
MNMIDHAITESIKPVVLANVCKTGKINTNEGVQHNWMRNSYEHSVVKHGLSEYVNGDAFINRIEGAFGHFKCSIIGVYHKIPDKHINRYLNMFVLRRNSRHINALLKASVGCI